MSDSTEPWTYASTKPKKKRTSTRPVKFCTRDVIAETRPQIIMHVGYDRMSVQVPTLVIKLAVVTRGEREGISRGTYKINTRSRAYKEDIRWDLQCDIAREEHRYSCIELISSEVEILFNSLDASICEGVTIEITSNISKHQCTS